MKKVAIMTWFNYHNFGTALQVTALSKTIENLGYEARVIQYTPHAKVKTLTNNYKNFKIYINKFNNKLKSRKSREIVDREKKEKFEKYINDNLNLTKVCNVDSQLFRLNTEYDAFVCGSDQIWAPTCFNPKYFLNFVQDTKKMIAYAPSIGLTEVKDEYTKERMKECIERFKHLSVREEQGKRLIKEICNKESKVVLDPTLLLSNKEWNNIAVEPKESEKYILCYFLGNNDETWTHVKELSKKLDIKLKVLPAVFKDLNSEFEIEEGVGPGEFLGLIKNAYFICTDSFHGTLFSIIYEKSFYTYERFSNKESNSQNSRIHNILKITNLENRIIKNKSKIEKDLFIQDFKDAKKRLEIKKQESITYLEDALKSGTEIDKTNIDFKITNTCCGCGICLKSCSMDAIDIKRDKNGFIRCFIDTNKCIKCGACQKVCPYNGEESIDIDKNRHKLFMIKSREYNVLRTSSSGGAGYEISKLLCENGYDVIGCTYDNLRQEARHKIVKGGNIDELNKFKGSKYIQSNMSEVIETIDKTNKNTVVFGTPCQIAGIDKLLKLKNKRDKFILVDLICHGVPTQNLWKKYINEGNIKYGYGLDANVTFRDKKKDWRKMHIDIHGNNKKYNMLDKKDLFYRFFLTGNCYMESCYECLYRTSSAADIRLGDYWGENYKNDKYGVSMVIAMNNNGEKILNNLNSLGRIEIKQMNINDYWTAQYPQNPVKPVFYENLILDLVDEKKSLNKLADKYCKEFEWNHSLNKIKKPLYSIYKKIGK